VTLARSPWGRVALHLLCLLRGHQFRWHVDGVLREVFHSKHSVAESSRSRATLCALVLCALLSGGLRVFAFPGAPAFQRLAATQVDGSSIYLHQPCNSVTHVTHPPMSASFTKSILKFGKIKPLDSHAWTLGWVSRPTCHRDPEARRRSEKPGTVGDAEAGANPPAPDRANPEDPS
jgi:hypothetical protein